jgi:hypothetical protein
MSDQPGIPAITVFPPFNPAQRQPEPVAEPARDQAEAPAEPPALPADAHGRDVAAPAAPAPWDFAAPEGDGSRPDEAAAPPLSEEEDLPWLEVPEPAPVEGDPAAEGELKADDKPNWMAWVRDEGQPEPEGEPVPIAELQPDEAAPWAAETGTETDDGAGDGDGEPWEAPAAEGAADETVGDPGDAAELPEPELYDLPDAAPAAAPWAEAEAPLFEPAADEGGAAEELDQPWELPSEPARDAPPAWESFGGGSATPAAPAEDAADAAPPATPFAAVADRLQGIADSLRSDPAGFVTGAQGGGDPLALLVAGFVLGYTARQGGGS